MKISSKLSFDKQLLLIEPYCIHSAEMSQLTNTESETEVLIHVFNKIYLL